MIAQFRETLKAASRQATSHGRVIRSVVVDRIRLLRQSTTSWSRIKTQAIVAVSLVFLTFIALLSGAASWIWAKYTANRSDIAPIVTFVGAGVVAWAALRQARTATRQAAIAARQAETAALRHEEQTKADRQRRITDSFSKAVEQLGSDKLEVRIGGIYTLERISRESEDDYWPIMETLTAFIREHARWIYHSVENEPMIPAASSPTPKADIAAILTVIARRVPHKEKQIFSLPGLDLRGGNLRSAHLEYADLKGTHLEEADLSYSNLQHAELIGVHMEKAKVYKANLEHANIASASFQRVRLGDANLREANLYNVNFDRAFLFRTNFQHSRLENSRFGTALCAQADFSGADLKDAHFEGSDLSEAHGLSETQLATAIGDTQTRLPAGLSPPAHWLT
jgi:uncharacterized protein YjbI with pentapeptide repeats